MEAQRTSLLRGIESSSDYPNSMEFSVGRGRERGC
jgi:hypothetical protein